MKEFIKIENDEKYIDLTELFKLLVNNKYLIIFFVVFFLSLAYFSNAKVKDYYSLTNVIKIGDFYKLIEWDDYRAELLSKNSDLENELDFVFYDRNIPNIDATVEDVSALINSKNFLSVTIKSQSIEEGDKLFNKILKHIRKLEEQTVRHIEFLYLSEISSLNKRINTYLNKSDNKTFKDIELQSLSESFKTLSNLNDNFGTAKLDSLIDRRDRLQTIVDKGFIRNKTDYIGESMTFYHDSSRALVFKSILSALFGFWFSVAVIFLKKFIRFG